MLVGKAQSIPHPNNTLPENLPPHTDSSLSGASNTHYLPTVTAVRLDHPSTLPETSTADGRQCAKYSKKKEIVELKFTAETSKAMWRKDEYGEDSTVELTVAHSSASQETSKDKVGTVAPEIVKFVSKPLINMVEAVRKNKKKAITIALAIPVAFAINPILGAVVVSCAVGFFLAKPAKIFLVIGVSWIADKLQLRAASAWASNTLKAIGAGGLKTLSSIAMLISNAILKRK